MFGVHLTLQATAALTMRVLPSGILDIISYPFIPPTTLSGWLRRVWMLAEGLDLPETSASKNAPYYVLPPEIVSLGAYPKRTSYIHKTKRKGVKDFSDTSFTRLIFDKETGPTFQLHTWEYLTTDKLDGYVVSEDKEILEHLCKNLTSDNSLIPWGCKLGKEGFAYLAEMSDIERLEQREDTLQPLTLLPIDTVINQNKPIDFAVHNIHRFAWGKKKTELNSPSSVKGYNSLPMALTNNSQLTTSWWYAPNMHFPTGLETVLAGVHDV